MDFCCVFIVVLPMSNGRAHVCVSLFAQPPITWWTGWLSTSGRDMASGPWAHNLMSWDGSVSPEETAVSLLGTRLGFCWWCHFVLVGVGVVANGWCGRCGLGRGCCFGSGSSERFRPSQFLETGTLETTDAIINTPQDIQVVHAIHQTRNKTFGPISGCLPKVPKDYLEFWILLYRTITNYYWLLFLESLCIHICISVFFKNQWVKKWNVLTEDNILGVGVSAADSLMVRADECPGRCDLVFLVKIGRPC